MKLNEFYIGLEFYFGYSPIKYKCTDVGSRTVAAIKLEYDHDKSWYNGPPYAVSEFLLDEYDLEECYLEPPDKSLSI